MRKFIVVFLIFSFSPIFYNLAQEKRNNDVYQSAPIELLLKGVMNGETTIGELKKHGNFGLGTFNGVDGEMVVLDGVVYQIKGSGKVDVPSNSVKTPFGNVTFFRADTTILLKDTLSFKSFNEFLDKNLPSKNLIYAVKVTGEFTSLKARSENKQTKPYKDLYDVLKNQDVFSYIQINGTLVGFKYPDYIGGVNVPGYHFHFISADKKEGGHVLDFVTNQVKIEIEYLSKLDLRIPTAGN